MKRDFTPDASGFAKMVLTMHGAQIKYAKDTATFYVYDAIRWVPDDKRATAVRTLIAEVHRKVGSRLANQAPGDKNGTPDEKQAYYDAQYLLALYKVASADSGRNSVIGIIKDSAEIRCMSDDFAKAPHLLNFKNGTIDLSRPFYGPEDGEPNWNFVQHDPKHMLATVLSAPYAEIYGAQREGGDAGEAPKWEALLLRAVDGDQSLADSLEEALAYGLYGANPEQLVVFLVGAPATGKTQIIEIIRSLAGSLGTSAETALIRRTGNNEDHDKIKSVLRGKHFITIDETDAHMRLDSTKLKQISGQNYVQTRKLHEEPVDTKVTWTLFVATNDLPEIAGSMDGGVERRLWLFPMSEKSVPERERNINLREEIIREEGSVIMWRLAKKLAEWYYRKDNGHGTGVQMHARSIAMRDEYQAASNTVQEFVTARLRSEEGSFLAHTEAFETYVDFCKKNKYTAEGKTKFTKLVRQVFGTSSDTHSRFRDVAMSYEAPAWTN